MHFNFTGKYSIVDFVKYNFVWSIWIKIRQAAERFSQSLRQELRYFRAWFHEVGIVVPLNFLHANLHYFFNIQTNSPCTRDFLKIEFCTWSIIWKDCFFFFFVQFRLSCIVDIRSDAVQGCDFYLEGTLGSAGRFNITFESPAKQQYVTNDILASTHSHYSRYSNTFQFV